MSELDEFREGPPRTYIPVSHPDRIGGPIGYVEVEEGYRGECPLELITETEERER